MAEEIGFKSCPFCGKAPRLRCQRFGMEKFDRYGVVCQGCGICIGWAMSEEEAAERWNRRAGDEHDIRRNI